MIVNSLSLVHIVQSQQGLWLGFIPRWNIFLQPVAFVVYIIAATAETNRLPFDLAESEQELVSGWHTEYSGMKFAMYMLAEYGNLTATTCIATILFFGGWNGPAFGPAWLQMLLPTVWFVLKIAVFIFVYVLARSTVPRIRYDQLMRFGWKYLLPVSLANIIVTSFLVAIS
jgi:NADH-quinone oxidoreductase subunit H